MKLLKNRKDINVIINWSISMTLSADYLTKCFLHNLWTIRGRISKSLSEKVSMKMIKWNLWSRKIKSHMLSKIINSNQLTFTKTINFFILLNKHFKSTWLITIVITNYLTTKIPIQLYHRNITYSYMQIKR